jgi:hypothetical protein
MKLDSRDVFGNSFVSIFMVCRAFGGRKERNRRAVFARGRKGLKVADTSVMNLVIILDRGVGEDICTANQYFEQHWHIFDCT